MEDKEKEEQINEIAWQLRSLHDSVTGKPSIAIQIIDKPNIFLSLMGDPTVIQHMITMIQEQVDEEAVQSYGKEKVFNADILIQPSNKIQLSMLVNKHDKRGDIIDVLSEMITKVGGEATYHEFGLFSPDSDKPGIAVAGLGKDFNHKKISDTLDQFFGGQSPSVIKYTKDTLRTYTITEGEDKEKKIVYKQKGADLILLDAKFFSQQANLIQLGIANTSVPDINMGRSI